MKYLLDTHTFLWAVLDNENLSENAKEIYLGTKNILYFSAASGWEIAIKTALGRLTFSKNPSQFITEQLVLNKINVLPVELIHALNVVSIPHYHRDPFDRMLISQAQMEDLSIVSKDKIFKKYDVEVIW